MFLLVQLGKPVVGSPGTFRGFYPIVQAPWAYVVIPAEDQFGEGPAMLEKVRYRRLIAVGTLRLQEQQEGH